MPPEGLATARRTVPISPIIPSRPVLTRHLLVLKTARKVPATSSATTTSDITST